MKIDLLQIYNHIKDTNDMIIITGNKKSIDEFVKDNDIELKDYKNLGVDSLYRFNIYDIKGNETVFVLINEKYTELNIMAYKLPQPSVVYKVEDNKYLFDKPNLTLNISKELSWQELMDRLNKGRGIGIPW